MRILDNLKNYYEHLTASTKFLFFLFCVFLLVYLMFSVPPRNFYYRTHNVDLNDWEAISQPDFSILPKEISAGFLVKVLDDPLAQGEKPATMELVLKSADPCQSKTVVLTNTLALSEWYSVRFHIDRSNRLKVTLDNHIVLDENKPTKDFVVSDVGVEAGFEKSKLSKVIISDFAGNYTVYRKTKAVKLLEFALVMLLVMLVLRSWLPLRRFLLPVSISYLLYALFYHFSSFIWLTKRTIPPEDLLLSVRLGIRDEGIEPYVLYAASFLVIFLTIVLDRILFSFKNKIIIYSTFFVLLICSAMYFSEIGVYPMESVCKNAIPLLTFIGSVYLLTRILLYWNRRHPSIADIMVMAICVPVCFIPIASLSLPDAACVFGPAIRLLHGFSLPDIYFQYDLFLPLIAAIWMKLNFALNIFQAVGDSFAVYVFIVGLFLFSRKIFVNKQLPIYFLVSLILVRNYAWPFNGYLQHAPFRLDLWLLILVFVYYKGIYHWTVGAGIGLLVLVHRNFGLIYLASYVQGVFLIFILDLMGEGGKLFRGLKTLPVKTVKHLKFVRANFFIISFFIVLSAILFHGFTPGSAILFKGLGIGFTRVSSRSFYWYIPVLFGLSGLLLFRYKNKLPENYFNTGFLLILLAIGNSLYFLGRSEDSNILSLSGIFIFLLFFLFDLLERGLPSGAALDRTVVIKKNLISGLAVIFLLSVTYQYSDIAVRKIKTQFQNLSTGRFIYPLPIQIDFKTINEVTNNSKKIYVWSANDFYYDYYGGYAPVGYYSSCYSWVIRKELVDFMQDLLDKGYYVVADFTLSVDELLPELRFNNRADKNGLLFLWLR